MEEFLAHPMLAVAVVGRKSKPPVSKKKQKKIARRLLAGSEGIDLQSSPVGPSIQTGPC